MKVATRSGKKAASKRLRPGRPKTRKPESQKARKRGRPKLELDMSMLEQLCSWGATHAELADWLHISRRTFEYWLADEKTTYEVKAPAFKKDAPPVIERLTLRTILERGAATVRLSIRRNQMKLLEEGSNTMAVWLGKQYLGQTDRLRLVDPKPDEPGSSTDVPITLEELLREYRKASK